MAEQFYTILTAVGKAKIANAATLGTKVNFTHLALGDGGGNYYNPTEDQTALRNEVWRGNIGNIAVDEENSSWIVVQTIIPGQIGGFMIREAGIFDDEEDLIAIGKYPETYKPTTATGSMKDLVVRMILEISNTASVVLKVDPTVILATQKQVDEAETKAKNYTDQKVGVVGDGLQIISQKIQNLENKTGNLDNLNTTEKSNLVAAISELKTDIGNLTGLSTDEKTDLVTAVNEILQRVIEHKADIASEEGRHGIRYFNEKLEIKVGPEWVELKSGSQYYVGNVANLSIITGNGEATIKWQDPPDVTIEDSMGNIIPIATWAGTKLVINDTAFPINENDGDLVVNSTVRDQYKDGGFLIESLENDKTYYIGLFPYAEDGAVTVDSANRASVTPRAYDDLSGSPGPKDLIAGDMEEGFFGEVSASEFITGDALASQVGISQGISQHSTAGWLKFAHKGKILFIAKKPIRHSISWDAINTAKCVYGDSGDKTVVIDGKTYKVTLMRALEPTNDPKTVASANNGEVNHGSEWNRLMCQIHEQALSKSWEYPDNVESNIGILAHTLGSGNQGMYNDGDLVVKSGDGRYSWCQEMSTTTTRRLSRGGDGVSGSSYDTSSSTSTYLGFRPRLELLPGL